MGRGDESVSAQESDDDLQALLAAGRHEDAAKLASVQEKWAQAAELYARIWRFGEAAVAARRGGDLVVAFRHALEARDVALTAEIRQELVATVEGRRAAVEGYERARRYGDAGVLLEELGELERAAEAYRRGHRDLDAARLLETLGNDREAGRLLEKFIEVATGDDKVMGQLQLGRILARRGSYSDAARQLQAAREQTLTRQPALEQLVATLAAMGLRDGARDVLVELRRLDPSVTDDLDGYLRRWRDAAPPRARAQDVIAGRYRLQRLLGSGGAGRVFLAVDEVSGRTVAIKMVHGADARGGAAFERFLREARIAMTLRHPSLVEVYDVLVDHGVLVMEYLPGGSLADRLATGPLPEAQVRRMALELLPGLELAHHRGVIHRDIKPANIFFDARGAAKLGDFGVAHLLDLGQTQTGGLIGTLAYMSPEQITGGKVSVATDFYALGITLFEALVGRLPFLGPDFVAQHLGEVPPRVTSLSPQLSPAWDEPVAALLQKSPEERTVSVEVLRAQLDLLRTSGTPVRVHGAASPPSSMASGKDAVDDSIAAPPQRYQFETPLITTPVSELFRAVDVVLDRSVVIERFSSGEAAAETLAVVRKLGAVASPFVQRALALDRAARCVVFEAPAGGPIKDVRERSFSIAEQLRMCKRLARAVASIEEAGAAHGAISSGTVSVDGSLIPTIMLAGIAAHAPGGAPRRDVDAVIAVVAELLGSEPSLAAIDARLSAGRGVLGPDPQVDGGEDLYRAFDALERAALRLPA
jgi:serine/threonine-protein kinase